MVREQGQDAREIEMGYSAQYLSNDEWMKLHAAYKAHGNGLASGRCTKSCRLQRRSVQVIRASRLRTRWLGSASAWGSQRKRSSFNCAARFAPAQGFPPDEKRIPQRGIYQPNQYGCSHGIGSDVFGRPQPSASPWKAGVYSNGASQAHPGPQAGQRGSLRPWSVCQVCPPCR